MPYILAKYSLISSAKNSGITISLMLLGVFGSVTMSLPLTFLYDFVIFKTLFSKSKSFGVKARSSPILSPHQ